MSINTIQPSSPPQLNIPTISTPIPPEPIYENISTPKTVPTTKMEISIIPSFSTYTLSSNSTPLSSSEKSFLASSSSSSPDKFKPTLFLPILPRQNSICSIISNGSSFESPSYPTSPLWGEFNHRQSLSSLFNYSSSNSTPDECILRERRISFELNERRRSSGFSEKRRNSGSINNNERRRSSGSVGGRRISLEIPTDYFGLDSKENLLKPTSSLACRRGSGLGLTLLSSTPTITNTTTRSSPLGPLSNTPSPRTTTFPIKSNPLSPRTSTTLLPQTSNQSSQINSFSQRSNITLLRNIRIKPLVLPTSEEYRLQLARGRLSVVEESNPKSPSYQRVLV